MSAKSFFSLQNLLGKKLFYVVASIFILGITGVVAFSGYSMVKGQTAESQTIASDDG